MSMNIYRRGVMAERNGGNSPKTYIASGYQEGDFLFLQASANSGPPALVLPAGWTQIVASRGFQHNLLLAYRIWHTGDSIVDPVVTNAQSVEVSAYRGANQASPVVTFNFWSTEVGGTVSVTEANTLVIDTMFNESLSTFTPNPPASETKRYGQVNAGHGMALADTAGTVVPIGTWNPGIWTGFNAGTGTTNGVMVVIR